MRLWSGRWTLLAVFFVAAVATAQDKEPPKPTIADAVKGAKALEGLLSPYFHENEQKVYLTVAKADLGVDFLLVASVARGPRAGELTENTIITLRRVGPTVQVVQRQLDARANPDEPVAGAVQTSYTDVPLGAMRIRVEEGDKLLVEANEAVMTGALSGGRSLERPTIESVKAYPSNMQIRVSGRSGGSQLELLQEIVRLPQGGGYQPRASDDRIGYFGGVVEDYSTAGALSPRVRFINRWKLEKVDPAAAVSDVKEPVVWWIEKTVPREFRGYVREGIQEWNKAFEKAGYRNAIEVRQQGDADAFDANDMRYNVFRWALGEESTYAIAVMTAHPRTGQMLCGRVVFHEGLLRSMQNTWARTRGVPDAEKLMRGEVSSWMQDHAELVPFLDPNRDICGEAHEAETQPVGRTRFDQPVCRLQGRQMQSLFALASVMYNLRQGAPPGAKVPVEFTGGFIKMIAMHEVGHCLGLRHNFRASTMLSGPALADKDATAKTGLVASVMDYVTPNLAIPGTEPQGLYFTPTIGPYDYLAIEYGYRDADAKGLGEIAARTAQPGLAYATDEDAYSRSSDPRVQIWDLGDPLEDSVHRTKLMQAMLPGLAERMVAPGESWDAALDGFLTLVGGFSRASSFATNYIAGWYSSRNHRGDADSPDPVAPAAPRRQREALAFITGSVLTEGPSRFDGSVLRKLGRAEHSDIFDSGTYVDPSYMLSNIQLATISRLLSGATVNALNAQASYITGQGEDAPLTPSEVYDAVVGAVFRELPRAGQPAKAVALDSAQRIVQRELVRMLANRTTGRNEQSRSGILVIESRPPTDSRILARAHLRRVHAGVTAMLKAQGLDALTQAHYEALLEYLDNALAAKSVFEL
ncbi:MAG: zinc-dependent metalloprotease [Armatimonadetes bacterium]|nr:zinc-dependent metalloprotease [Armatimonadota bacterium]